jgi:uncharacterized repeat protein (TIGR01451 family)
MKNLLIFCCLFLLFGQTNSIAQCAPDITPPVTVCVAELSRDVKPGGVILTTVNASDLNAGCYDACDPSNVLGYFIELAPQSATPPSTTSLSFSSNDVGDQNIVLWVVDAAGNAATCTATLHLSLCESTQSLACNDEVIVQLGVNNTYELTPFDMLEGGPYCDYSVYQVRLDQIGTPQSTMILTPDDIGVHLMAVSGTGNICWGTLIVTPGTLNTECPQLFVDLATPSIRPCINGGYQVFYYNASAFEVLNTYVDVTLDDALAYQGSSIPGTALGNQAYRFETGDLNAGQSGVFQVYFLPDCNAVVGATHCSEAHIFPDTICASGQPWSGAAVQVEGACVNDSIRLKITNIGSAATTQTLDYVVVEDVLMITDGTFSLASGAALNLPPFVGDGSTFRLEAQQEPGYPYGGMPSVTVEGCGGLHPGLVTIFPTENTNPAIAVYCRESTNSYDPNDKQALPEGYGAEHFIEKNTALNYMIRFQNTGTDTAFKVVLVDTLSERLDAASVRLGAASHPYQFDLLQGNILRITFDNILLPHKAVNEDGSQGFVQFSIQQAADNPDGTRIENTAAIYFDFNAPVITNQTFHTIGSKFVAVVSTNEALSDLPELKVFPNPTTDVVSFNTASPLGEPVSFTLTDAQGRLVQQRQDVRFPFVLPRGTLENGTYFFQFSSQNGRQMWSGKLLVK